MKLITERDLIRSVPSLWLRHYGAEDEEEDKKLIGQKLNMLDTNTCSAEDIYNIIGNRSWTRQTCSECSRDVSAVVRVGEEPDYESATAYLCLDCAEKVIVLLKKAKEDRR